MGVEKFIRGKIDSCHHAGRFSTKKRLDASSMSLKEYKLQIDPYLEKLMEKGKGK